MITLIALLRLLPLGIILIIALRRNYPRLALAAIAAIAIVVINYVLPTSADVRAIMGSIFIFLLMMHALRLPMRGEK